jgi:hypothetical protein
MARKKESFVPEAAGDAKHVAHKTRHLIGRQSFGLLL